MPQNFNFDPDAERFLARIQLLYTELPKRLGTEWPLFEQELQRLLLQHQQPQTPFSVVERNVRRLIRTNSQAQHCWQETTTPHGTGGFLFQGKSGEWLFGMLQPNRRVTRYTDVRCPSYATLDREFQVTIRLTLRPNTESSDAQQLSVLTRVPVTIELDAPNFILTEGNTRTIPIPGDRDTDWAVFNLKPLTAGPAEVRIRFWQANELLGQARCDVLVTEQPVTAQTHRPTALPLTFTPGAPTPKRILIISLHSQALHFSLYVDGAPVPIPLPPLPFDQSSARYMRRRYDRLNRLAKQAEGNAPDMREAAQAVKNLGNLLWTDLIPPNLKTLWLDEQSNWATEPLLVVSDESYIPWELIWPNVKGIDAPWGVHGPMSRWLGVDALQPVRSGPPAQLNLSPWAALFPGDSDLSHLPDEAAILRRLLPQNGEHKLPHVQRQSILDLLVAGECSWLHAGTHGKLDASEEAEGAALLLEQKEELESEILVDADVLAGLQETHPGVFWNICHGAAGGWALTGVGGWARRLIDGSASLFLSPQWTVTDKAALVFAEHFYSHLTPNPASNRAPASVAIAVQQARLAARELTGDPSWLAYALYAHPQASVEPSLQNQA